MLSHSIRNRGATGARGKQVSKSKFPVVLTIVNANGNQTDYTAAELRALARNEAKGKGKVETNWISARDNGHTSLTVQIIEKSGWRISESVAI